MKILRPLTATTAAAALVILCAVVFPHGFAHAIGIDTQQSDNYAFWSGIGPCLITAIGLSTLIAGAWHHLNCHADGCLRIGRVPVEGTPWRTCWHHHPAGKPTHARILDAHRKHTAGPGPAGERLYNRKDPGG